MIIPSLTPSLPPSPLLSGMLDRRHAGRLRKGDNLLTGEGEWGEGEWGEEPNHTTHKVRTYKEYHSVCPSSELGPPPQPPHLQASVPPPPCFWGEGRTLAGEKGVGRVPIPTRGIHCGTLYMYVLCDTTPRKPDPLLYWRSFNAYLRSIAIVEPELSIDNHFC